jgi:Gas vesicle protein
MTTRADPALAEPVTLVDLLDRVLGTGVVSGEVRLSIADVDLVTISLRALLGSLADRSDDAGHPPPAPQHPGPPLDAMGNR